MSTGCCNLCCRLCSVSPAGGAVEPVPPLGKNIKELMKKKKKRGELAFNCVSLTSWKELLCCIAHRNKLKEITSPATCRGYSTKRNGVDAAFAFCYISWLDRRCAGTCLQGKRSKFQSKGMRSKLKLRRDTITHPPVCLHTKPRCPGCNLILPRITFGFVMRIKCPINE